MVDKIIERFAAQITCEWTPRAEQVNLLHELIEYASSSGYEVKADYYSAFIEAVNQKLALNSSAYQDILDVAFADSVKLNYIVKCKIKRFLDCADINAYVKYLKEKAIDTNNLIAAFNPVPRAKTLNEFQRIIENDKLYIEVVNSIFSRYCFNLFHEQCSYSFFSGEVYNSDDYFDFINKKYPDISRRDCALTCIDVSPDLFIDGYENGCNRVLAAIEQSYQRLNNHCDMIILLPRISVDGCDIQWRLYGDIVLFAEKHSREIIDRSYFRWEKIAEQTSEYITQLNSKTAEFNYAYQGFVYKDCFVSAEKTLNDDAYSLLLVFEKNIRDERPVNCPACLSLDVQGNSYPILNVKSWECENPLCPERSKYNRGNRYAFMSLMRQKQMQNGDNNISSESVSKWRLDCLYGVSKAEIFEMSIYHYSCINDGVVIFTNNEDEVKLTESIGRKISLEAFFTNPSNILADFKRSSYFYRYIQDNMSMADDSIKKTFGKATVYCGDALGVLRKMSNNIIDAAVTSPPYYNAKTYSQWSNIYCYLYDMFNISKEVYRVLRPGAVYLFNIFDYFDNEKNVVFSAMGKKRMILGAYMLDIFQRIGFSIRGNIVWYKGEIQGNRSFNQGNLTPYYQAPLNCWEHVFILSKGTPDKKYSDLTSRIEAIKPVIKIVRGKNVLGHDAPFPDGIPDLVISRMNESDTVLDPFLGSGTTCIVANKRNVKSIGIEKNGEYFTLCQDLIANKSFV